MATDQLATYSKTVYLKQKVDSLVSLRHHTINIIEPIVSDITNNKFPSEDALNNALKALSDLSIKQKDLIDYLSISEEQLVTLQDIDAMIKEIELNEQIFETVENMKQSISKFIKLHCVNEDFIEEIKQQQATAKELLESYSSNEMLIELGGKYDLAIKIAFKLIIPEANHYSRITKEIGFATSYALRKGLFNIPDVNDLVAASAETTPAIDSFSSVSSEPNTLVLPNNSHVHLNDDLLSTGEYKISYSGKKLQRFSVSKFEQDLKRISSRRRPSSFLLTYINNFGVLGEEELPLFISDNSSSSEDKLNFFRMILQGLCQKGYLISCTVSLENDKFVFYTLSPIGIEAFQRETSRKQLLLYSSLKPIYRQAGEEAWSLEGCESPFLMARQLSMINQAQGLLEKALKTSFILDGWKTLIPMPHRDLEFRKLGIRIVLIAPFSNYKGSNNELNLIEQIIQIKTDCVPIIWTSSRIDGCNWSQALSVNSSSIYFLTNEDNILFLGDKEGLDCFSLIFDQINLIAEKRTEEAESADVIDNTISVTRKVSSITELEETNHFVKDSEINATLDNIGKFEIVNLIGQEEDILNEDINLSKNEEPLAEIMPYIEKFQLQSVIEKALLMVAENKFAEAMILLHSIANFSLEAKTLKEKISFILEDPLCKYEDLFTLSDTPINLSVKNVDSVNDYLNIAMWLRIFFNPDNPNDHRLKSRWGQINSDYSSPVLQNCPALKQLISHFWLFLERHQTGFKFCTSGTARVQMELTNKLNQTNQQLIEALSIFNTRNIKAKIGHRKAHQLVLELYGNNGLMTEKVRQAPSMPLDELRGFCQKFTSIDLLSITPHLNTNPDDKKLEDFIDTYWDTMDFKSNFGKNVSFLGKERDHQRSWLREAVTPLINCYIYRFNAEKQGMMDLVSPEAVKKYRNKASELMLEVLQQLSQYKQDDIRDPGYSFLCAVLKQLQDSLNEDIEQKSYFYESLLLTGEIELDNQYLPILDNWMYELPHIAGFRLWERAIRHCNDHNYTWQDAALNALRDYDMGRYDLIISRFSQEISIDESSVINTRKKAPSQITRYKEEFMTSVEIAQNYGQISSKGIMDNYFRLAIAAEQHAEKMSNCGFYNRLLDACNKQIKQDSKERMEATQARLEELKYNILQAAEKDSENIDKEVIFKNWPILDKIDQMLEKRNMTVAEDYIQLANNGYGQQDIPSIQNYASDPFNLFYERYQSLYTACNTNKSIDLNRIYEKEIKSNFFANQRNRNTVNADEFIRLWSKLSNAENIQSIIKHLSFHEIKKVTSGKNKELYIFPEAIDGTLGQYSHPFAAFGTQAFQKGLRVIHMAGTRSAENILDEMIQYGASGAASTIVLLDYALPLAERTLLAKSIKLRGIPEIIVVVDRVMALFLAGYNQLERGNIMLQIALPFSNVQPYIPNGIIPPEMFIGRTDELNRIRNLTGPVLVYGGRQLGKTALLRQAKNLDHHPEKGSYAVFIDLKQDNCHTAPKKISEELVFSNILDQEYSTWEELKTALKIRLSSKEKPIYKLLLLLDEADRFLSSCEQDNNRPLEILKELKDSFNDQFKFVLAGLRDVVRFNKRRLSGNSVLAHMGHITIRPLAYTDACDLLQKPLQYLGFRIDETDDYMISLILAKTNYYPGLIHFYCQKLIEATVDSYRNGSYNENSTPPYLLDEKHLKTLLGQSEFLEMIEDRFRITLQLDKDDLYDILANAMAYYYYSEGIGKAASVKDIMNVCKDFEIKKICRMTEENLKALLEEMDELNILRQEQMGSEKYIFNRYSFFQMLGSFENVWEQLEKYAEQGVQ
ncbi:AAA family ATPase [Paenibacillus sp. FSL R7-0333]|uniref:AAA family ATPase n=1 Tax=Paenibacillus sp. FSL R7-0333 TaxID=1926587 RepID=UPI002678B9EB